MTKKKIFMLFLMIPISVVLLTILSHAEVGASCSFVTIPRDITYQEGWHSVPKINTSSEVINQGSTVAVWIDSSGFPCPPYSWRVNGMGYEIVPTVTNTDGQIVTLTSASGT